MIESESLDVVLHVTRALDALDVRWVIGGSLASIVYGQVRTTMDADIVADLHVEHVPAFRDLLAEGFYVPDEATIRQAIENRRSFNLVHLDTMFKIDLFIPGRRSFDQQQLAGRVAEQLSEPAEGQLWILSPENTVLAKLDWYRMGGESSERQWRDVLGVLKTQQRRLDLAYLKLWAGTLQVLDLLERALEEASR